jgi:CheY-like chemotaxis protein
MSKVQHGKLSLNLREFDLRETVESVAGRCRHVLSAVESTKRHVALVVAMGPTPTPILRGDAQRIQQVMTNLGTNGIKYTAHGSVTLNVDVRALGEGEAGYGRLAAEAEQYQPRACLPVELCVRVVDTGIGIPRNALRRIFDLFETASGDPALADPSLGISSASGIGLSICKELVLAMGGWLSVESSMGAGSAFTFKLHTLGFHDGPMPPPHMSVAPQPSAGLRLPNSLALPALHTSPRLHASPDPTNTLTQLSRAPIDPTPTTPHPTHAPTPLSASDHGSLAEAGAASAAAAAAQPGRILLVEDDDMNRVVISMFLDGHALTEAHNGLEAVVAAHQMFANYDAVDMVLMDINMPMLTGRQATQLIRLMQYGVSPLAARIPIVALTANAMDSELRKCLDSGVTTCLTKPVPHQTLLDLVASALQTRRQMESSPASSGGGGKAAAAAPYAADDDGRAQVEASIPLLHELIAFLIAALQHDIGVRMEFEGRCSALLGCLSWALRLIRRNQTVPFELERLLEQVPLLPEDELACARAMLTDNAQEWL